MKFSVLSELQAAGVKVAETALRDIDSDRIDETLQVTVFRTKDGKPVQVLFSGDRLLSSSRVRQAIGSDDVNLDIRFFPRTQYPFGKFVRQPPLSAQQGVMTLFDAQLFEKDRVHVVSNAGSYGYFVSPSDLHSVFADATVAELTEPVLTSTMVVSPSFIGHQNESDARKEIDRLLGNPNDYLPVFLLPSSREELLTLKTLKGNRDGELSSILSSDPILLIYFLQRVFDTKRDIDLDFLGSLSIDQIIHEVGTDSAITIAAEIAEESSHIQMDPSGIEVIPQYFQFTEICAEISRKVVDGMGNLGINADGNVISNLIKCYRGLVGIALGIIDPMKLKEWIEATNANPHRYSMDVQYNILGFTLMDLAKYLTETLRFPKVYKVFFVNFGSPFYQGEYSDYVIINYIVSSFVSDQVDIDSALFKHLFKLHKHLAVKFGIMELLNDSFNEIPEITEKHNLIKWRFETVTERDASDFLKVSKVDRNYFVFR